MFDLSGTVAIILKSGTPRHSPILVTISLSAVAVVVSTGTAPSAALNCITLLYLGRKVSPLQALTVNYFIMCMVLGITQNGNYFIRPGRKGIMLHGQNL